MLSFGLPEEENRATVLTWGKKSSWSEALNVTAACQSFPTGKADPDIGLSGYTRGVLLIVVKPGHGRECPTFSEVGWGMNK